MKRFSIGLAALTIIGFAQAGKLQLTRPNGQVLKVVAGTCKLNADCDSLYHCNEFGFCIPGAPSNELPILEENDDDYRECGKRKPEQDCFTGTHCNEFGWCIDGEAYVPPVEDDDEPEIRECGKRNSK